MAIFNANYVLIFCFSPEFFTPIHLQKLNIKDGGGGRNIKPARLLLKNAYTVLQTKK